LSRNKEKVMSLESKIKLLIKVLEDDPTDLSHALALRKAESERNELLKGEEESWRMRSRALWLSNGDKNSRFFHKLASFNRVRKHIWKLKNGDGDFVTDQDSIKDTTIDFLKIFIKRRRARV
jgi:hypothetical protein